MLRKAFGLLLASLTCLQLSAAAIPEAEMPLFRRAYFAPVTSLGLWRLRLPNGVVREFQSAGKGRIVSCDGWRGTVRGETATIRTPKEIRPGLSMTFRRGRLEELVLEKKTHRFDYRDPVVYEDETLVPLFPSEEELDIDAIAARGHRMWKKGRQLKLWFASPNQAGAFLSFVFLIGLGVLRTCRGRAVRSVGAVVALAGFVLVCLTASRGAMVASAVGAAIVFGRDILSCSKWSRRRLVVVCLALTVVAGAFSFGLLSLRTVKGLGHSDAGRWALWQTAPRMLCDAPGGWGRLNEVGSAYSDWYGPLGSGKFRYNLINDHLTVLVAKGWIIGGGYLLLWFGGLSLLLLVARRGGSPIPAAVWSALFVASFFNVVLFAPTILWLPAASLLWLVPGRRWLSCAVAGRALALGSCGTVIALFALYAVGSSQANPVPSVRYSNGQWRIGGENPSVWIVDDGETIGSVATAYDIRSFYRHVPQTGAIGYVKDLDSLPHQGVRRLVLAGEACSDYLERTGDNGWKGVPPEVTFLSPPFPPSQVPQELFARTRVRLVMGEFAARYYPELVKPPTWVSVVAGAEIYVPGWMNVCKE